MNKTDDLANRITNLLRYTGITVPVIYALYGLLIFSKILVPDVSLSLSTYLVIGGFWVYMAIYQFFTKNYSKKEVMLRLATFHFLAAATLLFVTGVATVFAIFWILLVIISIIYFGRQGMQMSIAAYLLLALVDIVLHRGSISVTIALYDITTFIGLLIASMIFLKIKYELGLNYNIATQNKLLEVMAHDRFTTIINNMRDAVISTDRHGVVKIYNAATLNLLDTNSSLAMKSIGQIIHLKDGEGKAFSFVRELQKTSSTVVRDDLRMKQGKDEEIRIEVTYTPIRTSYTQTQHSDAHDGYIIMLRDVTKAKSLEEERDEFISVVSHELRTPITVVEGELSNLLLLMNHPDVSKQMKIDAVTSAHEQIIYLARMVNDLSTLSRAERGVADNADDIDVQDMIHKFYAEYEPQAKAKNLHLNLDLGAKVGHVMASRLYLEELLQNFITNGIKYTKEGSVTIVVKQKDGVISFEVKDTGIGISKSDQERVFEKFFRSEDYRTRETSGTGLGLYVARKLSHKLGTNIVMKSRLNHGSSFSFTLPAKKD